MPEVIKMAVKRHIDQDKKTVTIEFSNGQMFGPIEFTPMTDALTRMIGDMENRIAKLEAGR
jgi:hypothetical protein